MGRFIAPVISNEEIMPATHVLSLHVGAGARGATPGQFLHIRCGGHSLLRRPMSVYRTTGEVIQLMVREVGQGSRWLVERRAGDRLDCLGPQGHGFRLDRRGRHLLFVGGGYGVAPLVGLAERAVARGMSVALAAGASTADLVFPARLLPAEVEYLVATEDGSAGHHGLVTDMLPGWLSWADVVYSCGPMPMMAALASIMRQRVPRKPAQVALEERVGCSMGVCLGCVVETTRGPQRVCTEGPVFDLYQVVWREPSGSDGVV